MAKKQKIIVTMDPKYIPIMKRNCTLALLKIVDGKIKREGIRNLL